MNKSKNRDLSDYINLVGVEDSQELQSVVQKLLQEGGFLDKESKESEEKYNSNELLEEQILDKIIKKKDGIKNVPFRGPLRCALISMGKKYGDAVNKCEQAICSSDKIRPDMSQGFLLNACMTNPPFYEGVGQIGTNDYTVCSGSKSEMVTEGGEVAFLASIIMDSIILRESVLWYTAMVGKKSSLGVLLRLLKALGITNVRTVRFQQSRTCRWALAWSYTSAGEHTLCRRHRSADPRVRGINEPCALRHEIGVERGAIYETALASEVTTNGPLSILRGRVEGALQQWASSNLWICNAAIARDVDDDGVCEYLSVSLFSSKHERNNMPTMHLRFEVNPPIEKESYMISFVFTCVSQEHKNTACMLRDTLLQNIIRTNRFWRRKLNVEK